MRFRKSRSFVPEGGSRGGDYMACKEMGCPPDLILPRLAYTILSRTIRCNIMQCDGGNVDKALHSWPVHLHVVSGSISWACRIERLRSAS